VTNKADSKFKIVGAASIAAKVTRDACIEDWHFEESDGPSLPTWNMDFGCGYPSGDTTRLCVDLSNFSLMVLLDPKTQAWLKDSLEPTFGFPKVARFSWTTVKLLLEKTAHTVKWSDTRVLSLKVPSNID
jgi:ribonuclease H2 subunit A